MQTIEFDGEVYDVGCDVAEDGQLVPGSSRVSILCLDDRAAKELAALLYQQGKFTIAVEVAS
jgi:hypothetical protein